MDEFVTMLTGFLPQLIAAIAILIFGWLAAAIVASGVRRGLERTKIGTRISGWIAGDQEHTAQLVKWASRIVFYVLLLFVLIGFFQVLGLSQIIEPLVGFQNELFGYAPRLLGPLALAVVAWIVAKALRVLVRRGLTATKVDEKLGGQAQITGVGSAPISQTLSEAVYWITLVLFLPAILGALQLQGLLEPVRGMVDKVLVFLPNVLAAGLILFIGWFLARILRTVTTNLLSSIGVDKVSTDTQLSTVIGGQSLSQLVGLVVYVLVLVPILIAALNTLELEAVTGPASEMLSAFLAALPKLFAAAILLGAAYVVGRIISGIVTNLLTNVGIERLFAKMGLRTATPSQKNAASTISTVVFVAIMIFASIEALRLLEFDAVAELGADFLVFGASVVLGLIIIGIGLFLAALAAAWIGNLDIASAKFLALTARVAIIVLSVAIGLGEMGLAEEIIELAFGLMLGSIALAAGLAFGLGSRETAGKLFEGWVSAFGAKRRNDTKAPTSTETPD